MRNCASWIFKTHRFIQTCAFLLFSVFFAGQGLAQNQEYARQVLNTLCSPEMAGRGYVKEGVEKAADYLAAAYKKAGLLNFNGKDYFQTLGYPFFPIPPACR